MVSIEDYAFWDCDGLKSIMIPEGVTSIGAGAFMNCDYLYEVEIPPTMVSIGAQAFEDCGSYHKPAWSTHVKMKFYCRSMPELGENAFLSCPMTVYCYWNSEVEEWARAHPYNVVYLDNPNIQMKPGDASGDGMIDIFDGLVVLQYIVGWEVDVNRDMADVNNDSKVDIFDALLILQYVVGWDVELK